MLSTLLPLAYAFFLADATTDVDATNNMMAGLLQLSAYLLLMPLFVILASNLLFAIGFMAVGAVVNLAVLLFQGWNPVGFWKLFQVGIGESVIMWVGALPCILIVVLLDKNYIVSVVITFFYTILNYLLTNNDASLMQPFGLNVGTLLLGPLAFRWTFQFYDDSSVSEELAGLPGLTGEVVLHGGVQIVTAVLLMSGRKKEMKSGKRKNGRGRAGSRRKS